MPLPNETFDWLLAAGWRLIGGEFVRHNVVAQPYGYDRTVPLRIRTDAGRLVFSKSQKKLLTQNSAMLRCEIGRIRVTEEKLRLFERHSTRFSGDDYPPSVDVFLRHASSDLPVAGLEFDIFFEERLVACSFAHVGGAAISGTYCVFDPDFSRFSLGNYTLLLELLYAAHTGRQFYYPGYVYATPSRMDYKKNFYSLERYDWTDSTWLPAERNFRQ